MSTFGQISVRGGLRAGIIILLAATGGCANGGLAKLGLVSAEAEIQEPEIAAVTETPYHAIGVEHFRQGEYGLAERAFRDAVEKNPADTKSWLGLAAAYDRLQRFDLADKAYGKALELEPYNAVAWNNFGFSHLLRGDLANAGRALKRALELDGDDPQIQHNVDLLYAAQRGPKKKAG